MLSAAIIYDIHKALVLRSAVFTHFHIVLSLSELQIAQKLLPLLFHHTGGRFFVSVRKCLQRGMKILASPCKETERERRGEERRHMQPMLCQLAHVGWGDRVTNIDNSVNLKDINTGVALQDRQQRWKVTKQKKVHV